MTGRSLAKVTVAPPPVAMRASAARTWPRPRPFSCHAALTPCMATAAVTTTMPARRHSCGSAVIATADSRSTNGSTTR
jgi:hypothetical protein